MIFTKHKNKDVKVSGALIYGKLIKYMKETLGFISQYTDSY